MRVYVALIVTLLFVPIVEAANKQYPDPKRVTAFNNFTDNMATMGEDPQEAKQIVANRKRMRERVRKDEIELAKRKETRKRIKQEQKDILEKIYGAQ